MSTVYSVCADCDYLMNHSVSYLCERCGSKNVYIDREHEDEIEEETENEE